MTNLIAKSFEVRDVATFIPVIAVAMQTPSDDDSYLMRRVGYIGYLKGKKNILVTRIDNNVTIGFASEWASNTMRTAHKFIENNFDQLQNGEVIDVEFIIGRSTAPKQSERYTN